MAEVRWSRRGAFSHWLMGRREGEFSCKKKKWQMLLLTASERGFIIKHRLKPNLMATQPNGSSWSMDGGDSGCTNFGNKDKWDTTGNGSEKRSRPQSRISARPQRLGGGIFYFLAMKNKSKRGNRNEGSVNLKWWWWWWREGVGTGQRNGAGQQDPIISMLTGV